MGDFVYTWSNALNWLESNFFFNNGLPRFFIYGNFSYANKDRAIVEYIQAVTDAKSSDNVSFKTWANGIEHANYSVLENIDVQNYWNGLLEQTNRQRDLNSFQKLKFVHVDAASFDQPSSSTPKRSQSSALVVSPAPPIQRRRVEFTEVDGIIVDGIDSVGSFIGTLARNMTIIDRKSRYFYTLGMNGIIDLSDDSIGSQLSYMSIEAREQLKTFFPIPIITIVNQFDTKLKGIMDSKSNINDKKYLKKCVDEIKPVPIDEKYDFTKFTYLFILELHIYDQYIFDDDILESLSENDYVVKVWGPLMERRFRGSSLVLHWGDTTPSACTTSKYNVRLDLRVIPIVKNKMENDDVASTEFAKKAQKNKYYKDKLKTVLTSKIHFNQFAADHPTLFQSLLKFVNIPFVIIIGLQAEVCVFDIGANGLYYLNTLCIFNIPSNILELKAGGISDVGLGLEKLKILCIEYKKKRDQKKTLCAMKKKKHIKSFTSRPTTSTTNDNTNETWTRAIFLPPTYDLSDSSSSDDEA